MYSFGCLILRRKHLFQGFFIQKKTSQKVADTTNFKIIVFPCKFFSTSLFINIPQTLIIFDIYAAHKYERIQYFKRAYLYPHTIYLDSLKTLILWYAGTVMSITYNGRLLLLS